MKGQFERRTVYAITLVTLLAVAGGWAFAATLVDRAPPAQNSTVTVVTPNGATQVVQSSQLVTVSNAILGGLTVAGVQPGTGNGLNSSFGTNAPIASCTVANCSGNFSAVDFTFGLAQGESALQVAIVTAQGTTALGFDVQVEVIYQTSIPTTVYAFGSGYFDTGTTSYGGHSSSSISVFLYIDLGTVATSPPSVSDVVITVNACTSATTCP